MFAVNSYKKQGFLCVLETELKTQIAYNKNFVQQIYFSTLF